MSVFEAKGFQISVLKLIVFRYYISKIGLKIFFIYDLVPNRLGILPGPSVGRVSGERAARLPVLGPAGTGNAQRRRGGSLSLSGELGRGGGDELELGCQC